MCGEQERVVVLASQHGDDFVFSDPDGRAGVDELAEDGGRLCDIEALSDTDAEEYVEAADHQRELDVEIDAQGHGGGERTQSVVFPARPWLGLTRAKDSNIGWIGGCRDDRRG